MAERVHVVIDCSDPDRSAAFWMAALGYVLRGGVANYRSIVDPDGVGPKLLLQGVDDRKGAKNRVHLDIEAIDLEATAERLVGLGARRHRRVEEFGIAWIVMEDPDGNEFCVVPAEPS